jgi:hypothetical protein
VTFCKSQAILQAKNQGRPISQLPEVVVLNGTIYHSNQQFHSYVSTQKNENVCLVTDLYANIQSSHIHIKDKNLKYPSIDE